MAVWRSSFFFCLCTVHNLWLHSSGCIIKDDLNKGTVFLFVVFLSLVFQQWASWVSKQAILNFSLFFILLLSKMQELGKWDNKRNTLCKLITIYIMLYARNMEIDHIIYGRLRLPHSVPITYKDLFPPPLPSQPNWHNVHHSHRPNPHQTGSPTKGFPAWVLWLGGKSFLVD